MSDLFKKNKLLLGKYVPMAGIIPVAGQPTDIDGFLHPCMNLVNKNTTAIERSVLECVSMGCESVWIVLPKQVQNLMRSRMGDFVEDYNRVQKSLRFGRNSFHIDKKEIPIYYVPFRARDWDRRYCLSWSIITGIEYALKVANVFTNHVTPSKFYINFPYSVYPMADWADRFSETKKKDLFFASYQGKSFKDNLFLPFTMNFEDYITTKRFYRKSEKRPGYEGRQEGIVYYSNHFTHDFVFQDLPTGENPTEKKVGWYYDISTWEGYCEYIKAGKQPFVPNVSFKKVKWKVPVERIIQQTKDSNLK